MKVTTLRLWGTVAVLCLLCGCYAQPDQMMMDRIESHPDPSEPQTALPSGPQVEDRKPLANRPANSRLAGPQDVSFGTAEATIIDTRNFAKQIYRDGPFTGEQKSTNIFRPVKSGKPDLQAGPPNNLTSGGVAGNSIVQPQAAFPGISASPWTPPDPSLAAGPKHVIQTVNMELAFFGKQNGALEFQQRLDSTGSPGFFEELGSGDFCFDPKCFYDHYSQRYFVLALEVYDDTDEAWITIAVSDDNDPHGIWYKYRTWAVVDTGSSLYWVDYPGLGFDADGIFVTGNLFRLNGSGFGGVLFRSFDKTPLLSGATATYADIRDASGASVQVAQCFGVNETPLFVSVENNTQLLIQAISDPFTSPSLVSETVDVPFFDDPGNAPNPGGSLWVVGRRIMNAHLRDGGLWACHSIETAGGSNSLARWYEINAGTWPNGPAPALIQSGEVEMGPGDHTFFPAIYTNKIGNAALVFGKSSESENPGLYGTGRVLEDAPGFMRTPLEFMVGEGASGRWGDYFDIAIDPNDDRTFWMVGEYQSTSGWRTWIEQFTLEELSTPLEFIVTTGTLISGIRTDLKQDEDFRVNVASRSGRVVEVEFDSRSQVETPSQIWFTVQSVLTTDEAGQFEQLIELYDFTAGVWEPIDTHLMVDLNEEEETQIQLTGDLSRFVQAGTRTISARITMERQLVGNEPRPRFFGEFDLVEWTIAD